MDQLPDLDVSLTPRPAGDADGLVTSLGGTWSFLAAPPGDPPSDGDWSPHDVPGEWIHEGFVVPDGDVGWYRRTFSAPDTTTDRRFVLRFDAVYAGAAVWVNGERAGTHDGGYTPFDVDVTDLVRAGQENQLLVAVDPDSPATALHWGNVTGGITRDVSLVVVPNCHVGRVDVTTELAGGEGIVSVDVTLTNDGDAPVEDGRVDLELCDEDGSTVASAVRAIGEIEAWSQQDVSLHTRLPDPATWHPEHPTLYDLSVSIDAGSTRERIRDRVGVRDVAVDGSELLLNGESLTLRGVNWEEIHPDHGQAVPPDLTRRDAELLTEANVNYVRTAHHPPSEAFLRACDDLGIVVELEAPITFLRGDDADFAHDDRFRDLVCRRVLEAVERDRNRTCVCLWSLANESEWGENLEAARALLAERDSTRPTTFNWAEYDDVDGCDVANHHYPATRPDSPLDVEAFDGFDRPVLFGEFSHLFCYDDRELATDPGIRDDWVRLLDRTWERIRAVDACAGAALWAGTDHVHPTDYRWGMLDRHRRRRPEYWHVKKTYAPVELVDWERASDHVRVTLANRHDVTNLVDRRIEWRVGDRSGALDVEVHPGERATLAVPAVPRPNAPVDIDIYHPAGFRINRIRLAIDESVPDPSSAATASPTDGGEDRAERPSVTVDRGRPTLSLASAGTPLVDGLGVALVPLQDDPENPPGYRRTISHRVDGWAWDDVVDTESGIRLTGSADHVTGDIGLEVGDGRLQLSYEVGFHEDRVLREVGIWLHVPFSNPTLSWDRDAYWSAYPDDHIGRPRGTATAFPNGSRPTDDAIRLTETHPWPRDVTCHGSNDFRSTKRNVRTAVLTDAEGNSVHVDGNGDAHLRATVRDDGVDLLVLHRSIAGGGLPFLVRHPLLGETPVVEGGTHMTNHVELRLHSADR